MRIYPQLCEKLDIMRPNKFQIINVDNTLFDYECTRLIDLYNAEKMEFINQFYGFDIEYINHRLEDTMFELTGYDIVNQEPTYITKSSSIGTKEPNRADAWSDDNPIVKPYGNRVFTLMVFLSEGELYFPHIKLRHRAKIGDGLIWNNVVMEGRVLDAINQVSNDTYYIKKWVREKPFV